MNIFLLLISVAVVGAVSFPEWDMFKVKFKKEYKSEAEEKKKLEIFLRNKLMIEEHNKMFQNRIVSFYMKINHFSDMTDKEIQDMTRSRYQDNSAYRNGFTFLKKTALEDLPDAVDWNQKGAVSAVRNQGDCDSSWAFSAVGALEGQYFKRTNQLVPVSVQNLLDCSKAFGNSGCSGGRAGYAFNYIRDNGGIDSEQFYPYEGSDGLCRFKSAFVCAEDSGYTNIERGDEDALQEAVATIGPVAAVVDVSDPSFVHYGGGIYYSEKCQKEKASHSMLVVGYGKEDSEEFWLVKNSWGTDWGEGGYVKMARNKNNNCGIASLATFPIVP